MTFSTLSPQAAREMLADARDPHLRAEFARARAPRPATAEEGLETLRRIMNMLDSLLRAQMPRREPKVAEKFIL